MSTMAAKEPNEIQDEVDFSSARANSADSSGRDAQLMKRARRRLVGAIALVLLAIIVLPLVMDREPAPQTPEISVRIPNPDSGGLAAKPAPVVSAKPQPEPPAQAPVATTDSSSNDATKATASLPAASGDVAVATSAMPKDSKDKVAAVKKDEKITANEPGSGTTKPVEIKDLAATANSGKWEVQLGAYQSAGNVSLLMSKLKELKVPAYTEKFETPQGTRTRVRAGPFATKEAALAAQKRVRIIGVEGPVAPSTK